MNVAKPSVYCLTFGFYGNVYKVCWSEDAWLSPHNGHRHNTLDSAIRDEVSHAIRCAGGDPANHTEAIAEAIATAKTGVFDRPTRRAQRHLD